MANPIKQFEINWAPTTFPLKIQMAELQFEADEEVGFERRKGVRPIRKLLKNFFYPSMLDILFYVKNKGNTSKKSDLPIMNKLAETIRQAEKEGFKDVVILAHSLGSVIAYDYVFRFEQQFAFPKQLKLKALVTMGSPIGLFASGMGHPISEKIKRPPYILKWYNLWDHDDYVATRVEPHFEPEFRKDFLKDVAVNTGLLNPMRTHMGYWRNHKIASVIGDLLAPQLQGNTDA